ncbi:MAG: hypothetical protein EAZ91_17880 [Cytophagales bacterium]|nr:MAG: hypothetical protein EAZ91_17880 [Cytophagales bacterium]
MSQFIRLCKLWPMACLFMLWMGPGAATTVFAQTTEICNNGIDDDGDRLVDCQDPDCPECARFINCVEPNTCYMPPIWADPKSPTALSDGGDSVYGAQDLVLSTNAEFTTVNIRTPDGSYNRTVVVTATGSTIVQLPLAVVMSNSPNTIQRNKGLIITSDEPVQVTYRQTPGLNQDIVPLKCRAALGYSFYAGSQTRLTTQNVANERHFVAVMATQPNTVVTFRSPIAFDGVNTFPLSVTLQDNETYMLASRLINNGGNSANESVAGVLITSNQPIVVNSGSQHTSQPYSGNRDAGMDQLVPIRTTGTSYVAMHSQNTTNNSDYVFVIATENNTTVSISGPSAVSGTAGVLSTTTLSAGQVFTYNLPNVPNRAYSITTDKRAYVYHVSSYAANEFGMGILPTINPCNGSKRIDFYRTTGSSNDQAVVTIPTAGLASLTFRGAAYTTYGTVVDNITIAGVAHSIVSFPNGSIAPAGTVNTLISTERFHVGVVSNTGGASTGNFGFYSNYEAKVDVLNPVTKQPDDFYTVAQVVAGVATPHCLTLTSCGTDDRITGIVNGTYTQGTSFSGACLSYTMRANAPKCARDTIRVQVENNIGRQGIICLEFVNIDNNLITSIIPDSPVVCQPGGRTNLTIVAAQTDNASGVNYTYQTITPDKQIISTSIVSGTATGIYRISVTDSNGCRDTTNITARPDTATIGFGSGPTTVCAGATATYTVTSTTGTYGWSVTGGTILAGGTPTSNSATIRWTSSGTLRTTITNSNGCTAVATRAVTVLPVPTLSSTQQNPLCNGTSTGSINLAVASGSSPYQFRWNTGATTEDISALPAGVYSVTVTDKFGCTPVAGPLSATLTNVAGLSATTSRTNLLCNGALTGTAGVTATGGTLPYRYIWSNGVTTQTVTGLAAGSYTVTVQDANNCTLTQVVSVTQPTAISPILTRTNVACNGGSTGSLTLTVSGGTPGYSYRWSDGTPTQNRTGLPAGAYSVTITDANGCTALASTQLTEPPALTLAATATNVQCNGAAQGSVDLTVSGGTPIYTYRWTTGATTEDLGNLAAGVYSVTATDANACTRTLSVTVAQPSAMTLTLNPQNPTCDGGKNGAISTNLTGGTVPQSYRWSDGGTTATRTGLAAGTYSVTATDANGCIVVATTTLVAPPAITATGSVTNVACSGGATGRVNVSASGGTGPFGYVWNTGATTPTISSLAVGEYSVTITDANGCRFDYGATVLQPRPLSVTVLATNAPCFGGSGNITTEVRGGTEPYSYRWSNGATSPTIFGLPAGTYQLVVTDANGCTATTSAIVNQPPAFAINAIVMPVGCNGKSDASINATVEGGTSPYQYRWSTGATTEDLSNLPAGVYSLTVTDAQNCIESVFINVQEPPLMTLTSSQTNVACFGGSTGAIDLGVSGGTQPYAYQWADNITTEDRLNLQAGTFRVVVTDKNSCTATRTMSLTQPTALTVMPSVSAVSCNGGSNGAVALSVSGGVGPYGYRWVTGATSPTLNGLMTGFYSATVSDANSCTVSLLNQITQPSALTVRTTQQDATCNGGTNGAITITVSGGTPGYRYSWADAVTTPNRTGLSAGTYSLTILDANNCGQFRAFTIGQPSALSLAATVQPVACAGGSTGSISLNLSGGVGPYDVRWNDNNTATNRTGLVAGTYSVTATDANLCTLTRTFSVTQPTPLAASGTVRNVSCAGGTNGTISLTVSGGTSGYTYTWSGGVANPSAQNQTGLAAGPYTVSVQDANGCQTSRSFSLTQPEPLRVTARTTPASCFQGTDGATILEVSGGTRPYAYAWQSGQSTSAVSGLAAGAYSVTVTDGQGCAEVVSASISQPALITMMVRPTPARCNGSIDGAADLSVSGGIAPYRFAWTTLAGTPVATTEDLSNVRAGAYVVTVTDLNNCPASMTVSIGQPSALSLTLLGTNNLCPSDLTGAINLTVTGGMPFTTGTPYTYLWNNSFTDRNIGDLMPGSYSVVVTDANGCTATGSTSLTAPPALVATFSTTNVSCAGGRNGAIDLTVTGGVAPYSYTWVDGYDIIGPFTQDRTNLSANTYTVTVRDQNGCRTDVVITITQPTALSLSGSTTAVSCNGGNTGSLSVTALGGTPTYAYRWNTRDGGPGGTSPTLTAQPAGIYTLTATDANQCSSVLTLTVAQPPALSVTAQAVNVSCEGGSNGTASVTVSGGLQPYRYRWSTGASTSAITGLVKGNYQLVITDANGCTIAASVAITQPLTLTASVLGTDALCFGGATGTITTEVRGGTPAYTYRWSTGSTNPTAQSLAASSSPYSLTVTDANGCTALTSTTIGQPQP